MELHMLNRQHGRMILESVEHGPLLWPTVEEDGVTRLKKYFELSAAEAIQADSDMLMQGTSLTKQEQECKLYDAFDKFAYQKGETLCDFYLRFSLLLNDMNMYNMKLEQFQVDTKFLNTLPPEWSKFVTDVKLMRDLHTTNVDQLHAYLGQHEYHANEVRLMHERTSDPLALVSQHQLHSFRLSQAQILWGLFHKRNIDYAFLIWEDFVYQVEHKNQKKSNEMYYPRFTKVIIHHFMTKKPSIPRRNKINWRYVRDDKMFSTIKVVSRHQNTQQYGAILPIELTNKDIKNIKAYKEYHACATGEAAPKPKASAKRKRGGSDSSTTPPTTVASPRPITTVAAAPRLTAAAKGKQPARATSPHDPSEVERTEAEQLKIVLRRSRRRNFMEEISWNSSDDEDVDAQDKGRDDDDDQDDAERDDDDDDDDKEEIAKLDEQEDTESGKGDAEETESDGESQEEETREEEEESFDPIPRTPEDSEDDRNGKEDQGLRVSEEQRLIEEEEVDELYRDVDINQGRGLQVSQDIEDSHVTLTLVNPDGQKESSSVSSFVTSMLNPISDVGVESIFTTTSSPIASLQTSVPIMTPSTIATITTSSDAPILLTTILSAVLQNLPTFDSVFHFKERVKSLEVNFSEFMQTNQFAEAVSNILVVVDLTEMELKKILMEKMEGNKSIQRSDEQRNLYKALVDAYKADKTILESYRDTAILKKRRGDDDDQEGPSAGSDRGSKRRREGGEPESASTPSEPATRSASRLPPWKPPTPDRDWNKTLPAIQGCAQTWISELEKQADSRSSFNELLDTPIDFSNFIMNRLCIDTLTPELLAKPTYKLMRGSCQQYPHNLLQPLSLISDNRGRRVILFAHFINNDLEYLRGGASSRKYTTSVTKTKAADYGHIKWIEDLVPRTMWIQEPLNYNKHALWGVSPWGRKRKLSNLTVEERFDFNVSLWMFTRSIVIQRRVEDLQLGVKSYQKRLNLTKPDTYRFDLKRREAYTAYSNLKGFIYQNKDKKNRLMRIDELHKFSDGTLNDVRNALDDHLKGIRMQYLPQTIRKKGDKDRAVAMIQSIDKMLKTRRIMRSLERFVGGRLHIKWIEDLVTHTMWIQEPLNYDKHALWGVSHWGRKRQQFYGFAVSRESALDVYSKRRIIVVTDLKIVEWHNYKHLDWISIRRKLSNLTVEERFAFNVSLRMFTRSIVIQRRVEDLQLGVKSYQRRLNLTKPDTYRSDLKRRETYTAYSNPRGIIYQNKDKKNRLMRIDELHKFSDGTLNDVRNALDDCLKGIKMQYLPQTIWRKGDKDRAAAMIQSIDKMLKTRRIMRSLERFVGGRLYEGDFRMPQRTI
uniref:Reverse transcriptase domain-containing protein n=1 Tax=Tanacetum cinerariifolium TaxID=118510 RepID=A0A699IFP3_TANCI|nr:hypothetical protein [Tanacetum cinerariifolium]